MYDAVILFAEALSELDRSQDVQVNPPPHPENKTILQTEAHLAYLEFWMVYLLFVNHQISSS